MIFFTNRQTQACQFLGPHRLPTGFQRDHGKANVVKATRQNPGKITYGSMPPSIAVGLKYVEFKETIKMYFVRLEA